MTDVPEWATSSAEAATAAARAAGKHPGPAIRHLKQVLDFIGTGGQTVAPPSVHDSGEVREWEPGHGIEHAAVLPFEQLWDAVCRLAEACGATVPDRRGAEKKPPRVRKVKKGPRGTESVPEIQPQRVVSPEATPVRGAEGRTPIDVPMPERVAKCREYLKTAPLARSGHGGHDTTFAVARAIVNDYAVDDTTEAMKLLAVYNDRLLAAKLEEWTMSELEHKLDGALAAPPDPRFPYGASWGTTRTTGSGGTRGRRRIGSWRPGRCCTGPGGTSATTAGTTTRWTRTP
jgi:hypothetical protein